MKDLIIVGAGGHGRVIADIAQKRGEYDNIAFLDDGQVKESLGLPVIGQTCDMEKYIRKADIFVAIGNNIVREQLIEKLLGLGASIPTLIHPNAVVASSVEVGRGTCIMAGAVVNPCAKIGKGVILNTNGVIDHDCIVEDYAHVSVGAQLAGMVHVGRKTFLGIGSAVKNNVSICANCMIGAGAVVVKDIEESGTYIGVPAKKCTSINKIGV